MTEQATRFAVLTTQRSGSTWLMSVLNGIDGVTAQGELFLDRPRSRERRWDSDFSRPRYVESRDGVGTLRPFSVFRYLNDFYAGEGSRGFKLMYSQVKAFPEIVPYLMRNRISVIHLVRRNHLDVLISFAVKREIGLAHVLTPGQRPADVTVELDTSTLLRDLERLDMKQRMGRKLLRACRLRHIEVSYEGLVSDHARFDELIAFLALANTGEAIESNILRSRVGTQRQVVRNYDDVKRIVESSRFSRVLE